MVEGALNGLPELAEGQAAKRISHVVVICHSASARKLQPVGQNCLHHHITLTPPAPYCPVHV
eukprot:11528788-Alexandrium_andersonii.AAC.1